MATTRLMALHVGKGRSVSTAIREIIGYVKNPEKTQHGQFVTGYHELPPVKRTMKKIKEFIGTHSAAAL